MQDQRSKGILGMTLKESAFVVGFIAFIALYYVLTLRGAMMPVDGNANMSMNLLLFVAYGILFLDSVLLLESIREEPMLLSKLSSFAKGFLIFTMGFMVMLIIHFHAYKNILKSMVDS